MADPITPVPDRDLQEELDRSREEVLRLRDLLLAKDAELGRLKGRVAELESHARLLIVGAAQLSRVPGLRRLVAAGMRRALARLGRADG